MNPNLPDQSAPVALPPEMLDKILENIPANREGQLTLRACALAATWWKGPSQRRLFSSVSIRNENHQRWMDGVVHSGSKTHLIGYARSLQIFRGELFGTKYRMRDLPQDSGEYSSALSNIRSLMSTNIKVEHVGEEGFHTCFSAFRETLTFLFLEFFSTSFSAFVALVDYFPNITTLRLRSFDLEPDEEPVPTLSRPFRGKLYIQTTKPDPFELKFFGRLAKLNPEYEELAIDAGSLSPDRRTRFVKSVLQISTSSVKYLKLAIEPERE